MGDKASALKLAAVMLLFVAALVALESGPTRQGRSDSRDGLAARAGAEPLVGDFRPPARRWPSSPASPRWLLGS